MSEIEPVEPNPDALDYGQELPGHVVDDNPQFPQVQADLAATVEPSVSPARAKDGPVEGKHVDPDAKEDSDRAAAAEKQEALSASEANAKAEEQVGDADEVDAEEQDDDDDEDPFAV